MKHVKLSHSRCKNAITVCTGLKIPNFNAKPAFDAQHYATFLPHLPQAS